MYIFKFKAKMENGISMFLSFLFLFIFRVFPGRWLGPWTGCRALEAAAAASPLPLLGFKIQVLGGTGGGAPALAIDKFLHYFEDGDNSKDAEGTNNEENREREGLRNQKEGFLLLIPLVLGVGKVRI